MNKKQLKHKATALSIAAVLTLLGAHAAFAESLSPAPISVPAEAGDQSREPVNHDGVPTTGKIFEVKGTVEYVDLEGGYYAVDGWRLIGDEAVIKRYAGQTLFVEGAKFAGVSIYMNQALVVSAFTPISAEGVRGEKVMIAAPPRLEGTKPVPAPDGALVLTGAVEYADEEGGLYKVDGYALMGVDPERLTPLLGRTVTVAGASIDGPSIFMTKLMKVQSIKRAVASNQPLPDRVSVEGVPVQFDQAPVLRDGTLMIPLRAVVEAAGGTVAWQPEQRAVTVRLYDRTATFTIGQELAEMNQDGHYYLVRNMLKMDRAPIIENGRTLIAADALHLVLGLFQAAATGSDSDLILVR